MIISHKHKFIYWKPYKTASTSIMHGLGKYCDGETDVVGSLNWDNEGYAKVNELDEHGNLITKKFQDYGRNLYDANGTRIFADNHVRPHEIKQYVGDEIWNSYFKVTSVRNPWDRCVSAHCFDKKQKNLNNSLETYISKDGNRHMFFDDMGSPLADFYIRYENLQVDYDYVCKRIGIPQHELPKLRTTFRNSAEKNYRTFYETSEQIEAVRKSYKYDIEYFGYEFDPRTSVKKLLCIYTHLADAERLNQFKNTSMYNRAVHDPNVKIIEVYAGAPETKYSDGRLFLSCNEKYSELSTKTYEMLKFCTNNFQFDHLIKIDSSVVGYAERTDTLFKPTVLNHFYDLNRIESMMFSDKWLDDYKGYCGSHLLGNGSRVAYEKWADLRGVSMNYHAEFLDGTPFFYTGKMYAVNMEFAKYIADHGEELAIRHVKNVGGSEDTFVGRMFSKFHRTPGWECMTPWLNDYRETSRINQRSSSNSHIIG